ncbi:hypothetical protein Tco_0373651, partial [Tanacetum coccineum]
MMFQYWGLLNQCPICCNLGQFSLYYLSRGMVNILAIVIIKSSGCTEGLIVKGQWLLAILHCELDYELLERTTSVLSLFNNHITTLRGIFDCLGACHFEGFLKDNGKISNKMVTKSNPTKIAGVSFDMLSRRMVIKLDNSDRWRILDQEKGMMWDNGL